MDQTQQVVVFPIKTMESQIAGADFVLHDFLVVDDVVNLDAKAAGMLI
jgi:hypothetical protein